MCSFQGGVWGGGGFKSMHAQRFQSSFVTSGTTGGDIGQKPTIVAPRVATSQPVLPPPPVVAPMAPAFHSAPGGAALQNAANNASVQAVGLPLSCSDASELCISTEYCFPLASLTWRLVDCNAGTACCRPLPLRKPLLRGFRAQANQRPPCQAAMASR